MLETHDHHQLIRLNEPGRLRTILQTLLGAGSAALRSLPVPLSLGFGATIGYLWSRDYAGVSGDPRAIYLAAAQIVATIASLVAIAGLLSGQVLSRYASVYTRRHLHNAFLAYLFLLVVGTLAPILAAGRPREPWAPYTVAPGIASVLLLLPFFLWTRRRIAPVSEVNRRMDKAFRSARRIQLAGDKWVVATERELDAIESILASSIHSRDYEVAGHAARALGTFAAAIMAIRTGKEVMTALSAISRLEYALHSAGDDRRLVEDLLASLTLALFTNNATGRAIVADTLRDALDDAIRSKNEVAASRLILLNARICREVHDTVLRLQALEAIGYAAMVSRHVANAPIWVMSLVSLAELAWEASNCSDDHCSHADIFFCLVRELYVMESHVQSTARDFPWQSVLVPNAPPTTHEDYTENRVEHADVKSDFAIGYHRGFSLSQQTARAFETLDASVRTPADLVVETLTSLLSAVKWHDTQDGDLERHDELLELGERLVSETRIWLSRQQADGNNDYSAKIGPLLTPLQRFPRYWSRLRSNLRRRQ
jgi:hypothetical protein